MPIDAAATSQAERIIVCGRASRSISSPVRRGQYSIELRDRGVIAEKAAGMRYFSS